LALEFSKDNLAVSHFTCSSIWATFILREETLWRFLHC